MGLLTHTPEEYKKHLEQRAHARACEERELEYIRAEHKAATRDRLYAIGFALVLVYAALALIGCTHVRLQTETIDLNVWTLATERSGSYNLETGEVTYNTSVDPLTEAIKKIPEVR